MRLLGWDTSSKEGALVALEWDPSSREGWAGVKLVSEWSFNLDVQHSERLLWGVHQVLEAARWKIREVDLFAVGVGPGSFTGLRIGVTTARTLAHTLGKPLVGVSSLAALARPIALAAAGRDARVVVVAATDACKGELFALCGSARAVIDCVAMSDGDAQGLWKRGVEERVYAPEELVRVIKRKLLEGGGTSRWIAIGEGRQRYQEAWRKLSRQKELALSFPFADQVQGRYLGQLAWEACQARFTRNPLEVHPRYLRASDAELKLRAGKLPPGPTRGGGGG